MNADKKDREIHGFYMIVFWVMIIILFHSCSVNGNSMQKENEQALANNYERDYVLTMGSLVFDEAFSYAVDGTENNNFPKSFLVPIPSESKRFYSTNFAKLYSSLLNFYTEPLQEIIEYQYAIAPLATKRYISIVASFITNEKVPHVYEFDTCVTVALEQEKEIFLNELIDVNDEFIHLLKEGYLAKSYLNVNELTFKHSLDFSMFTEDELRKKVDRCSGPTIKNHDNKGFYENYENYLLKPSFYLAPNQICFVNFTRNRYGTFYISLDDIEKFLKVEKW